MEQKLKQRICIEFCVKLQISATDTFEMLNKAFPNNAPKRTTVFEWHSRFKAGRISIEDDPRQGLQHFKGLMKMLKKTPAKFIPRFLTNEQKLCRLATCEDMLEMTRTDPEWKDKIITGDKTWVYGYDPETKRQSAEWRGQEQTVIKEMYLSILRRLREAIRKKMPEKWTNGDWILHHDNARPHTAHLVTSFLAKNGTEILPQPPYSPDIAPNDFFLFPKLKAVLKGRHFDTREDIIEKSLLALKSIPKEAYKNCFDNWEKRWRWNRRHVLPLLTWSTNTTNTRLGALTGYYQPGQLSPGYKCFKGQILNADDLEVVVEGLQKNGILARYTHLLTGYCSSLTFLEKVCQMVQDLRKENPNLVYLCDPVMGDNGHWYVPQELLPVYRDQLVPLADIITPNQFEAELLTGLKLDSEAAVVQALGVLQSRGCPTVVISSVALKPGQLTCYATSSRHSPECYGMCPTRCLTMRGGAGVLVRMTIPPLPATFTGSGDLFSALFLAWISQPDTSLKVALERAVNTVHAVLAETQNHIARVQEAQGSVEPYDMELRIIQSKAILEKPPSKLQAEEIQFPSQLEARGP
ncbi:PDXK [Cordylochernes scorpioides]|uniref:Pyridoxal kinase n=1 Tax=Cordylochernes scorpioides TaxID=51811 RepID=A0ABY6LD29_9ARAC|nr:PDXK [Cordylochernes scorpioides]